MVGTASALQPIGGAVSCTWTALAGTENGAGVDMTRWPDKSVQAFGTFTSITIQGSNDGVTYHTLNDQKGDPLILTVPGIKMVAENTVYIRPASVGAATCTVIIAGFGR